jgi:hypothetical protein
MKKQKLGGFLKEGERQKAERVRRVRRVRRGVRRVRGEVIGVRRNNCLFIFLNLYF